MSFLKKKVNEIPVAQAEEVEEQEEKVEQKIVQKKEQPRFELIQVPETMRLAVYDHETKEPMTELEALIQLKNAVERLEKYIAS